MQTRWRRRLLGVITTYRWVDLDNSGRDRRLWCGPLDRFDAVAVGFIGAIALVLLLRANGLHPFISDTYYHLAIAKQINVQGQLPSWVDWDYAPVGRPHLYPPLIHLVLAGLAHVTGSVLRAGQVLAVLFFPTSLLSCWFAARWILGSRAALVAVLALSLDVGHAVVEMIYIPSCLVNILAPVLVVTFLTRRTWASIILLSLMLYSHIAIPYLTVLGLALFAWKYPRYRVDFLKVAGVSLLWVSPWVMRAWMEREWLTGAALNAGLPMSWLKRVFSLQMVNLVLIGGGLLGLRKLRRSRAQEGIVGWMLLGMLPLLFSYGGRFTMHSAPWFAIGAGALLVRLLPPHASWRRAVALTTATLLPLPALVPSRFPLMPITAVHAIAILAVTGKPLLAGDQKKSEAFLPDCYEAIRWVERHTRPGQVVHTNKEWIGDLIPLLSDRRSDFGCWWECSREVGKLQNRYYRDDGRRAVFLCIRPDTDVGSILGPTPGLPVVDEWLDIGRFRAAVRWQRAFSARETIDDFEDDGPLRWRAVGGDAASVLAVRTEAPVTSSRRPSRYLSWTITRERAGIERSLLLQGARGLALNVRTSAPLGDLKVGLTEDDGSRYEYSLALPCIAERILPEQIDRALWMRVRVPFEWMTRVKDSVDENKRLDTSHVRQLWLALDRPPRGDVRIDLDDVELMDVAVIRDPELGR